MLTRGASAPLRQLRRLIAFHAIHDIIAGATESIERTGCTAFVPWQETGSQMERTAVDRSQTFAVTVGIFKQCFLEGQGGFGLLVMQVQRLGGQIEQIMFPRVLAVCIAFPYLAGI